MNFVKVKKNEIEKKQKIEIEMTLEKIFLVTFNHFWLPQFCFWAHTYQYIKLARHSP